MDFSAQSPRIQFGFSEAGASFPEKPPVGQTDKLHDTVVPIGEL